MAYFLGNRTLHNVSVVKAVPVAPPPAWLPAAFQTPPKYYILAGIRAQLANGRLFIRRYVQARKDGDDWYLLC